MPPSTQKRIRDLERLLKKAQEASNVSLIDSLKTRIEGLQQTKEDNIHKEKKKKHENKYHMVKFFERKKVTRYIHYFIKQIEKLTASEDSDKETEKLIKKLNKQKEELVDDLAYIMYYPVDLKYIALFASNSSEDNQAENNLGSEKTDIYASYQTKKTEITGKTLDQSNKARDLARAARQKDIDLGKRDLVEHAIDVELKGKKSKEENDNSRVSNKRPRKESNPEEVDNEEPTYRDDNNNEDNNDIPKAKKQKSEKKEKKEKKNNSTEDQTKKQTPVQQEPVPEEKEYDNFFVEEANADEADVVVTHPNPFEDPKAKNRAYQRVNQVKNQRKFQNHQQLRQLRPQKRSMF